MGMESPTDVPAEIGPKICLATEEVERQLEEDPTLVPLGPSPLLVEPSVLEPREVEALLAGLAGLLCETDLLCGECLPPDRGLDPHHHGVGHEPDTPPVGCA